MISYKPSIEVYLVGVLMGRIYSDTTCPTLLGITEYAYYLPNGYEKDESTKIYGSVDECRRALEHEE